LVINEFADPRLSSKVEPREAKTALGLVEYYDIGDGPPVVALHGVMGGCDQSLFLAQTIGDADHRYIAMSRPGYLGTPIASGRSPQRQGDLVAALLDQLGIGRAGVMAVSGGGPAALQFALRHPTRCAGLVLVATKAERDTTRIPLSFKLTMFLARRSWFAARLRRKAEKNLEAVAARAIRDPEILARTVNDPDTWPLFSTMLLSTYDRMPGRLAGTMNDIEISRSATYPLEDLGVPVLVVQGTQDPLVPFEVHARAYERRVPQIEILAVEGGRHVAIFTHRSIVRPKVIEFMQRHFAV
jgi:pimeloyl-ACP methyl ester carboxylesterase